MFRLGYKKRLAILPPEHGRTLGFDKQEMERGNSQDASTSAEEVVRIPCKGAFLARREWLKSSESNFLNWVAAAVRANTVGARDPVRLLWRLCAVGNGI